MDKNRVVAEEISYIIQVSGLLRGVASTGWEVASINKDALQEIADGLYLAGKILLLEFVSKKDNNNG